MNTNLPIINSERWMSLQSLPGEVWIVLLSISPYLLVSNYGRVKRHEMIIQYKKGPSQVKIKRNEKILQCLDNGHQYLYVSFCQKKYYIHRLVALGFIPNPQNLPHVDHINGDRQDNRAENLRWATPKQNRHNAITEERCIRASIEHGRPVIQLTTSGEFVREWYSQLAVVKELGCSAGSISSVLSGRAKTVYGYRFIYKDEYDPNKDYSVVYKKNTPNSSLIVNDHGYIDIQNGHVAHYFGTEKDAAEYYGVKTTQFKSNYKRLRNGEPVGKRKKFKFPLNLIRVKDLNPNAKQAILSEIQNLIQ